MIKKNEDVHIFINHKSKDGNTTQLLIFIMNNKREHVEPIKKYTNFYRS